MNTTKNDKAMSDRIEECLNGLREALNDRSPSWSLIAHYADEFLAEYAEIGPFDSKAAKDEHDRDMQRVDELTDMVREYTHDVRLPALPKKPDGSLFGVGFIYDEDRDNRVLLAIERLIGYTDIVALAEHEGGLEVYTRHPLKLHDVELCHDVWSVTEYVPEPNGRWSVV